MGINNPKYCKECDMLILITPHRCLPFFIDMKKKRDAKKMPSEVEELFGTLFKKKN